MSKLTQHGIESQEGGPGLLSPDSVPSPVQVAHARLSRILSPLSGVELTRVTDIHPILWLHLFLRCAELKEECCGPPRDPQLRLG